MGVLPEGRGQAVRGEGDFAAEGADARGDHDVTDSGLFVQNGGAVVEDLPEQFIGFRVVVAVVAETVGETQTQRFLIAPVVFQDLNQFRQGNNLLFEDEFFDRVQAVGRVRESRHVDGLENPPRPVERVGAAGFPAGGHQERQHDVGVGNGHFGIIAGGLFAGQALCFDLLADVFGQEPDALQKVPAELAEGVRHLFRKQRLLKGNEEILRDVAEAGLPGDDDLPAAVVGESPGLPLRDPHILQVAEDHGFIVDRDDAAPQELDFGDSAEQFVGRSGIEADRYRIIADVEFFDDVQHEKGHLVFDLSPFFVDAAQDDVLVVLGVAGAGTESGILEQSEAPFGPLDPEMGDEFPRFVEGDDALFQVVRKVGPEDLVETAEPRPVAAQPLELEEAPEGLKRFGEGFGRIFRHPAQTVRHGPQVLVVFCVLRVGKHLFVSSEIPVRPDAHGGDHVQQTEEEILMMGVFVVFHPLPDLSFQPLQSFADGVAEVGCGVTDGSARRAPAAFGVAGDPVIACLRVGSTPRQPFLGEDVDAGAFRRKECVFAVLDLGRRVFREIQLLEPESGVAEPELIFPRQVAFRQSARFVAQALYGPLFRQRIQNDVAHGDFLCVQP